jgi:hypothetical protein
VKPTPEEQGQTKVVHEQFGWVPEGGGKGPTGPLHKLNDQHNQIRFGDTAMLSMRSYEFEHQPHGVESAFVNHREPETLNQDFREMVSEDRAKMEVFKSVRKRPLSDVLDEDVFMQGHSAKGLPQDQLTHFVNESTTVLDFLPVGQEPNVFQKSKRFRRAVAGTWRY